MRYKKAIAKVSRVVLFFFEEKQRVNSTAALNMALYLEKEWKKDRKEQNREETVGERSDWDVSL